MSHHAAPSCPRIETREVKYPSRVPATSSPLSRLGSVGMSAPIDAPAASMPGTGVRPDADRRRCAEADPTPTVRISELTRIASRICISSDGCKQSTAEVERLTLAGNQPVSRKTQTVEGAKAAEND